MLVKDLLAECHYNCKDGTEAKRREEISVNLLRLVWEFEEGGEVGGGETERGSKREKARRIRA